MNSAKILHTEINKLSNSPEVPDWVIGSVQKLVEDIQNQASETMRQQEQTMRQQKEEIIYHKAHVEKLVLEIAQLRRLRFGQKSEILKAQNLELFEFEDSLESDLAAAEAELIQAQPAKPPRTRSNAGRQKLPEHLPRIEHRHEPESCNCGKCGQQLVKIGEDISEQLDVEPAKFFVQRHIRPQYACRSCETVEAAAIPPAVIDGSLAAVGLLTWVTISKYQDHLPLYRLEQIAQRSGVSLPRSTLAEWIGRIGFSLQPLADRLQDMLRQRTVLHADETPVAQLDPGRGKSKRAYLWAYMSTPLDTGPPIAVFDYQGSRAGKHVQNFLSEWRGSLMVDEYAGYKSLFAEGVIELACLAHARRKFYDLNHAQPNAIAQEALNRIAKLYEIEVRGKQMSIDERTKLRQDEAKPLLESMHDWLLKTRTTVSNGGGTAKAMDYSLRRWAAIRRYAKSGYLPIDNNPVENVIRPIAIGRKNWLFAGSERAGQRAAAIQSLLATAKLNGLDPAAWLLDTLEKLPTCKQRDIDTLLPLRQVAIQENGGGE